MLLFLSIKASSELEENIKINLNQDLYYEDCLHFDQQGNQFPPIQIKELFFIKKKTDTIYKDISFNVTLSTGAKKKVNLKDQYKNDSQEIFQLLYSQIIKTKIKNIDYYCLSTNSKSKDWHHKIEVGMKKIVFNVYDFKNCKDTFVLTSEEPLYEKEFQIELQKRKKITYTIITSASLVLGIFGYYSYKETNKKLII